MDERTEWKVDRHQVLNATARAWLLATYEYTAPAEHTYAALVSILASGPMGTRCLVTFPYTFVLATAQTGALEAAIDAECRTRLTALRNVDPLASILDRRHWL